jgi:hypothetical protein
VPGRAVRFRGLLSPGAETLGADDDFNAIWRSKERVLGAVLIGRRSFLALADNGITDTEETPFTAALCDDLGKPTQNRYEQV